MRSLSAMAPVVASLERTAGVRDRVAQQLFGPAAIPGRWCFVDSPTLLYRLALGLLLAVDALLLGYL